MLLQLSRRCCCSCPGDVVAVVQVILRLSRWYCSCPGFVVVAYVILLWLFRWYCFGCPGDGVVVVQVMLRLCRWCCCVVVYARLLSRWGTRRCGWWRTGRGGQHAPSRTPPTGTCHRVREEYHFKGTGSWDVAFGINDAACQLLGWKGTLKRNIHERAGFASREEKDNFESYWF